MKKNFILIWMLLATLLMAGCATQTNKDPLEGLNRGIYKFNDVTDKAIFKPVAGAYKAIAPSPIQTGISNFFANLRTFMTAINEVLQFKFHEAGQSAGRFAVNTTIGIGGLFDVASKQGIPQYKEDFGQTLGHWGVGNGAYVVIPFLGPSTLRDGIGDFAESATINPIFWLNHNVALRNTLIGTLYVSTRASYLPGSDLLDEAALDPYTFMRDAYLQRRENQINGDKAPVDNENFENEEPQSAK
jgi:phospholipid-binding lipoprotein MlaA